jgi:hypothetical protein
MVSLKNRALVNQVRNYGDRASDLEQQLADRIENLELELGDAAKHLADARQMYEAEHQAKERLIRAARQAVQTLKVMECFGSARTLTEACDEAEAEPASPPAGA